jgi:hypothetical protein
MGCKYKKNKIVLYYDKNNTLENFVFSKTAVHTNPDGTTFDSEEVQKRYILKDKNGVVKGETQFYDHKIITKTENITFYTNLFRLSLGGPVDEQYNLLAMSVNPDPIIYNYKLTNTAGKSSFTHLRWNFSKPIRKLTFYRKTE